MAISIFWNAVDTLITTTCPLDSTRKLKAELFQILAALELVFCAHTGQATTLTGYSQ